MDSSDNSFAWTEASNTSEDSDMGRKEQITNGYPEESEELREDYSENENISDRTPKQKSRISDRIQYEEDIEINGHVSESSDVVESTKIRRFLKSNPHLNPITKHVSSLISKDDDIWILHCPHGIDVTQLENSDITIDEKCKMKVDSQTFQGTLDTDCKSVAVVNYHKSKPIIKNLLVQGVVNFKKKIPRPHLMEDNMIENNQTNFIPLPDTKFRHPLFGPDYKRALKIPSEVKSRLNAVEVDGVDCEDTEVKVKTERKKKKKHKKERMDVEEMEAVSVKTEVVTKKRKRQSSEVFPEELEEKPVLKKPKKIKHDPDKVWESEEAIKESLFNF